MTIYIYNFSIDLYFLNMKIQVFFIFKNSAIFIEFFQHSPGIVHFPILSTFSGSSIVLDIY